MQYFIRTFGVDRTIVNVDQTSLHRNESSCQTATNFKSNEIFVKENYHLTRKRATAFTQIPSSPNVVVLLEFVFQGTGERPPKLSPQIESNTTRHQKAFVVLNNFLKQYRIYQTFLICSAMHTLQYAF